MQFQLLEIAVLLIIFLTGAPINIYACVQLWRPKKPVVIGGVKRTSKFSSNFLLLQKFLNLSDILIVYVYVLRELIELILNREWFAGSITCKLCHMAETFGLSLSSNTLVCIAVDRLMSVSNMNAHSRETVGVSGRVLISALLGLFASFLISFPQVFLWDSWEYVSHNETTYICSTTWQFDQYENVSSGTNLMELYASLQSIFISPVQTFVVAVCYLFIGIFVYRSIPSPSLTVQESVELLNTSSTNDVTNQSLISRFGQWQRNFKKSIGVFKAATILVVIYAACWLPYNIAVIWSFLDPKSYLEHSAKFRFSFYLIALNAVINPIVYKMCQDSA